MTSADWATTWNGRLPERSRAHLQRAQSTPWALKTQLVGLSGFVFYRQVYSRAPSGPAF